MFNEWFYLLQHVYIHRDGKINDEPIAPLRICRWYLGQSTDRHVIDLTICCMLTLQRNVIAVLQNSKKTYADMLLESDNPFK